ncbi:MAG: hypothetical protein IH851_11755 [Armatimonadetes bacterium]|nr:hypothetical protein [Armatimonadota bacterium]
MHSRLISTAIAVPVLLGAWTTAFGFVFSVTYPAEAFSGPFSGRVVVYLSKSTRAEPRFGPNWFSPQPAYSAAFKDVKPGAQMVIRSQTATGFPGKLDDLEPGEYTVQAVIDRNLGGRTIGRSPGNLYSKPVRLELDPATDVVIEIVCDQVVEAPKFRETRVVKEVRLPSRLLSEFYKRPTTINAAVVLPDEWFAEPERKFPLLYSVPSFGGTHMSWSGRTNNSTTQRDGVPFIFVALDPSCPAGHSVFADSANNGPWGKALTEELIPHIEKEFRGYGEPGARYVTGHSSGGWSSLWLQVAYPDVFGGCWATSPDPVDFRDFQRINIYSPGVNMFLDEEGDPRPLARQGTRVLIYYRRFSDMERPIRGEQLGSFEAAFSPRGPDGEPLKLWNRDTGTIDPKVAAAWKKYDIGLILRTRADTLKPKLAGKIYVYMGTRTRSIWRARFAFCGLTWRRSATTRSPRFTPVTTAPL